MNIAILTEYRKEKGIGHLIRTYSIVNTFREKNYNVEFIIDTNEKNILIKPTEYINFSWLSRNILSSYDAILIDTYSMKKSNWVNLKQKSNLIFYIDDCNIQIPFSYIISIKVAIEATNKGTNPQIIGTKYFPLRKEIKEIKNNCKEKHEVLVMFGGTDIRELSISLLPILKNRETLIFNIITANTELYNKIEGSTNINKYLSPDISSLCNLMKKSKFAIISGGTILYELAYLQMPVIVIEVIDNQKKGIEFFKRMSFIEESFLYNEVFLNKKINSYITKLINEYDYFKEKAKIGKTIVDGEGSKRITKRIIEYIKDIN